MVKTNTFQKILDGATLLFAQHGYDGAIMDDLAEQCGVNKASIYYHHKDKATLYENVLTALFIPIADAVVAAVELETDPVKKLDTHIKTFSKTSAENPCFASILMREMASGGVNMPARAREQMQRILFLLNQTLQLGQAQHIFQSANPLIIHFMIVGTINLFVSSTPFRQSLPITGQCDQLQNSNIESAAEQISKTIINSLLLK
ncbi:MAG: TetR/AcrR family transcriptional regulator [Pseudomonadales bacterium]|nr:TetR/AcrR family transcriptional regulator [Pseudomonadales bacterium]